MCKPGLRYLPRLDSRCRDERSTAKADSHFDGHLPSVGVWHDGLDVPVPAPAHVSSVRAEKRCKYRLPLVGRGWVLLECREDGRRERRRRPDRRTMPVSHLAPWLSSSARGPSCALQYLSPAKHTSRNDHHCDYRSPHDLIDGLHFRILD